MKRAAIRKYPCPHCNGAGVVLDDRDQGQLMRERRQAREITLRMMAKGSGLSVSYLCDAELGRRRWNTRLLKLYEERLR